jgi:hypothetical protein
VCEQHDIKRTQWNAVSYYSRDRQKSKIIMIDVAPILVSRKAQWPASEIWTQSRGSVSVVVPSSVTGNACLRDRTAHFLIVRVAESSRMVIRGFSRAMVLGRLDDICTTAVRAHDATSQSKAVV